MGARTATRLGHSSLARVNTICAKAEQVGRYLHIGDLGGLLGRTLIFWLDHPSLVTGDTHLCFGRLVLLSPIKYARPRHGDLRF